MGGLGPFGSYPIDRSFPWTVELVTGDRCSALQGAHDNYRGRVVDYFCVKPDGSSSNLVLLRGLDRSEAQWTFDSAFYESATGYRSGPLQRVATAYYAIPDGTSERLTAENDYSLTGLGGPAAAASHGDSTLGDGIDTLQAVVCAGDYAMAAIDRLGSGFEYGFAMIFRAGDSGWEYVGSTDYLQPGDFGIPTSTVTELTTSSRARRSPATCCCNPPLESVDATPATW